MTTTHNSNIHLLAEHIIDQIKAGEVIERPSTLLKEVLENSIDANATKIDITLVNNGMDLIEVHDNGDGMHFEDLPLAFCRHATSKLNQFEDLYNLYTYGFRGEALASIASVSKVTCRSSKKNDTASTLKIEGGEMIVHSKEENSSTDSGTSLYIKDLFFNTPVRLKFVQSKTSEKNHLNKIIRAYILTNPNITFSVKWDDKKKQIFPAVPKELMQKRISKLLLKQNEETKFHFFNGYYDYCEVDGYISYHSSRGNSGKHQYLFVNNRYIQDITLHKIILNTVAPLWNEMQTGHYIISLKVPTDQIDVNVHPNKTVIKFFQPSKIYSLVSNSIKKYIKDCEVNINTSSNEIVQSFNFEQSPEESQRRFDEKTLSYTETDFSTLHQYKTSDSQTSQRQNDYGFMTIYKSPSLHFIKIFSNQNLLLIDHERALKFILDDYLKKSHQVSSSPLLISTPIYYNQKETSVICDELSAFGIELDRLSENALALRSQPLTLNNYPLSDVLNEVFKSKNDNLEQFLSNLKRVHLQIEISEALIREMFKNIPMTILLEHNVCSVVTEAKLRSIFS
jgi:DNA mismatch repair protein MutL